MGAHPPEGGTGPHTITPESAMAAVRELARLLSELEDQLAVCMKCGMCHSVCPLYGETGREADVARGKLALLEGLSREIFRDPAGVSERLNRCLLCGSCAAGCPSGVKVFDIFIRARAILAGYMGLPPVKKLVFRGLLAHPALFDRLLEMGARMQGLFARPVDDLLGTSCARFVAPLFDRHFVPLAPRPLHTTLPGLEAAGASGKRVGFFVGCIIDKVYPRVAEAALSVLAHHGVGVSMPSGQACCGIPALASGDVSTFSRLVRENLALFDPERLDAIVTACATCTSTIVKLWPMMATGLTGAERARLDALVSRTRDVGWYLVREAGAGGALPGRGAGEPVAVTYHDPCHLKKSLKVSAEPRALIRANPAATLREMAESDWCCGMGGSFNLAHYELSREIGERKRENIERSGARVVATGCPACMLQISDMLSQGGRGGVAVRHFIEIYAEGVAAAKG